MVRGLMRSNPIPTLRVLGKIEAISFLLLVGIAMPMKYLAGKPELVKIVGWAHGVLFVAFCAALLWTWIVTKWPIWRAAFFFVAALLPFGPFLVDRRLLRHESEFLSGR